MAAPPPPPPTEGARAAARESVADRVESTAYRVAMLLAQGWTQRDIAAHLGVHRNTVARHARKAGFAARTYTKKESTS